MSGWQNFDAAGKVLMTSGATSVSSVAFTATPTGIFDVTGSPITSTGTIALSMDNQSANTVLAGPASGGATTPAFRALAIGDTTAGGLYPYIGFAQVSYATSGATDGGTATSGAWRTYSMNTEDYDVGSNIGTPSSNQFTIAAGTYDVEFDAQLYRTDASKIRLYDTTNTVSLVESQSAFVSSVDSEQQTLIGSKRITITGTPTLELQYYCQTTQSGNGLGNQYNTASSTQIFARVRFLRVA